MLRALFVTLRMACVGVLVDSTVTSHLSLHRSAVLEMPVVAIRNPVSSVFFFLTASRQIGLWLQVADLLEP